MSREVTVRVPATSANLGPGFDCLGLALDLWNETTFAEEGEGYRVEIDGLGAGLLPKGADNLILRMALRFYQEIGQPAPRGLRLHCANRIPLGGGLGSSAAAILTGLLGANALLGSPAGQSELLSLAVAAEGHPDNVAAALTGGLVLSAIAADAPLVRRVEVPALQVAVATPDFDLPTRAARAALPRQVPLEDAVFNLTRTAFVVEALRSGDLDLLGRVMADRLHQPYRFKLIPGAEDAARAARESGAVAVALSGAGPSLIAFAPRGPQAVAAAMAAAFRSAGLKARGMVLGISGEGASVRRTE